MKQKEQSTIKEAVVLDEANIPLNHLEVKALPKGFTSNKTWGKHSKFDAKQSKYLPSNRYNKPVEIKAKDKRKLLLTV